MKEKITLEKAKEVAENLKKKYKFGKPSCPAWFKNTCTPMAQDGSYGVSICIPAWGMMTQDESDTLLEPFEGLHIGLNVVTPAPKYEYGKKNDTSKDEGKKNDKKKRRSHRKGYR